MLAEFNAIVGTLTAPSDWAIIGGAALAGFVLDLWLNIIGVLSPGQCAIGAGSAALIGKRGWEARRKAKQDAALLALCQRLAEELSTKLDRGGRTNAALSPRFAADIAKVNKDSAALQAAILEALLEQ